MSVLDMTLINQVSSDAGALGNAEYLVQDVNSYAVSISYDDNHYTTGTS